MVRSIKEVLVLRIDHLGDLVLTTPLIRALATAGHRVTVVARRSALPVLDNNPHITGMFALEDIAPGFPTRWRNLSIWLRRQKLNVILLPHAKPGILCLAVRVGFFGRVITMWGGVAARLMGMRALRSGLPLNPRHISDIWLDMGRSLGVEPAGLEPEIFLTEGEKTQLKCAAAERGIQDYVVIHPGCAGNTCNLPPKVYIELAQKILSQTGLGVVITGSGTESKSLESHFALLEARPRYWNSMGELDLRSLCALVAGARALVCVGTGPLHIASALKTPTVSPFCNRIGVSSEVWGNKGGAATVLTPPLLLCAGQVAGVHCDFQGAITSEALLKKLLPILANQL